MKIKRGEVWVVDLTPDSMGVEINKKRPCAVVNNDGVADQYVAVINNNAIGVLPLRIVVPLTEWNERYSIAPWHIPIDPNAINGLTKKSSADTFQVRSICEARFIKKVGEISAEELEKIKQGISICLDIDDK